MPLNNQPHKARLASKSYRSPTSFNVPVSYSQSTRIVARNALTISQPHHSRHDCDSPAFHLSSALIEQMRSARHAIRLALECRAWEYASGHSQWHQPCPRLDFLGHVDDISIPEVSSCKLYALIC